MPRSSINQEKKPRKISLAAVKREKERAEFRKLQLLVSVLEPGVADTVVRQTRDELNINENDWPMYVKCKRFFEFQCEASATLPYALDELRKSDYCYIRTEFVKWALAEKVFTNREARRKLREIGQTDQVHFVDTSTIKKHWIQKNTPIKQPQVKDRKFFIYVRNKIRKNGYISTKKARMKAVVLIGGNYKKKYNKSFTKLSKRTRTFFNLKPQGKNGNGRRWVPNQ